MYAYVYIHMCVFAYVALMHTHTYMYMYIYIYIYMTFTRIHMMMALKYVTRPLERDTVISDRIHLRGPVINSRAHPRNKNDKSQTMMHIGR